jgi:hypothetical protein
MNWPLGWRATETGDVPTLSVPTCVILPMRSMAYRYRVWEVVDGLAPLTLCHIGESAVGIDHDGRRVRSRFRGREWRQPPVVGSIM